MPGFNVSQTSVSRETPLLRRIHTRPEVLLPARGGFRLESDFELVIQSEPDN